MTTVSRIERRRLFEAAEKRPPSTGPISAVLHASFVALLFLSSACASKPPKPVQARAQLVVSEDVNPDTSGRASPIVVRLFQLKNDGEFAAADFFAIYEKEKETLGASLLSREEYVLAPGEKKTLDLGLNPEARFVGAIAAYRDIRSSHWRALTQAPEKK